jgi:hypothetical protein
MKLWPQSGYSTIKGFRHALKNYQRNAQIHLLYLHELFAGRNIDNCLLRSSLIYTMNVSAATNPALEFGGV